MGIEQANFSFEIAPQAGGILRDSESTFRRASGFRRRAQPPGLRPQVYQRKLQRSVSRPGFDAQHTASDPRDTCHDLRRCDGIIIVRAGPCAGGENVQNLERYAAESRTPNPLRSAVGESAVMPVVQATNGPASNLDIEINPRAQIMHISDAFTPTPIAETVPVRSLSGAFARSLLRRTGARSRPRRCVRHRRRE